MYGTIVLQNLIIRFGKNKILTVCFAIPRQVTGVKKGNQTSFSPEVWFFRELKQRLRRRQESNTFRLVKQQLCSCIRLFCKFCPQWLNESVADPGEVPPPPRGEDIFFETPPSPPLNWRSGSTTANRVKLLNFTFCGGREHKGNDFLFLSLNFDTVLKIQPVKSFLTFDELNEME